MSPAFDYTSGNPANLVGGTGASMADIQGPFTDLKTFLNNRIAAIPSLVTNLPVGPVDGQEIYYLADATNGVVWHLRYRSASGSSFKWEYVGGSAMRSEAVSPTQPNSASAWLAITGGPSLTAPLAGDYEVRHGGTLSVSQVSRTIQIGVLVAGTIVTNSDQQVSTPTATGWSGSLIATTSNERKVTVAATNTVAVGYFTSDPVNIGVSKLFLSMRPIRVG